MQTLAIVLAILAVAGVIIFLVEKRERKREPAITAGDIIEAQHKFHQAKLEAAKRREENERETVAAIANKPKTQQEAVAEIARLAAARDKIRQEMMKRGAEDE